MQFGLYSNIEIEKIKLFSSKNIQAILSGIKKYNAKGCEKKCAEADVENLKDTIKDQLNAINEIKNIISIENVKGNISSDKYGSNTGGYDIDIEWGGCPFSKGERVQYAVAQDNQLVGENKIVPENMWNDLSINIIQGNEKLKISSYSSGQLYFRIKPFTYADIPDGVSVLYDDLYIDNINHFGQYSISIEKEKRI